ncbi:MAG: hypothetical protein R3D51_00175 [Hyphomicrobiaceae bacterium]
MAKSKAKQATKKSFVPLLKPVSPEINGVVHPRRLVPGRELESVLTGIKDAQAILEELRSGRISQRNFVGLCDAVTVLDAARRILAGKINKD